VRDRPTEAIILAGGNAEGLGAAARGKPKPTGDVYALNGDELLSIDFAGLLARRYNSVWLTVNAPKDLRRAEEYLLAHPGWPA
jgi:hypothetical protein